MDYQSLRRRDGLSAVSSTAIAALGASTSPEEKRPRRRQRAIHPDLVWLALALAALVFLRDGSVWVPLWLHRCACAALIHRGWVTGLWVERAGAGAWASVPFPSGFPNGSPNVPAGGSCGTCAAPSDTICPITRASAPSSTAIAGPNNNVSSGGISPVVMPSTAHPQRVLAALNPSRQCHAHRSQLLCRMALGVILTVALAAGAVESFHHHTAHHHHHHGPHHHHHGDARISGGDVHADAAVMPQGPRPASGLILSFLWSLGPPLLHVGAAALTSVAARRVMRGGGSGSGGGSTHTLCGSGGLTVAPYLLKEAAERLSPNEVFLAVALWLALCVAPPVLRSALSVFAGVETCEQIVGCAAAVAAAVAAGVVETRICRPLISVFALAVRTPSSHTFNKTVARTMSADAESPEASAARGPLAAAARAAEIAAAHAASQTSSSQNVAEASRPPGMLHTAATDDAASATAAGGATTTTPTPTTYSARVSFRAWTITPGRVEVAAHCRLRRRGCTMPPRTAVDLSTGGMPNPRTSGAVVAGCDLSAPLAASSGLITTTGRRDTTPDLAAVADAVRGAFASVLHDVYADLTLEVAGPDETAELICC